MLFLIHSCCRTWPTDKHLHDGIPHEVCTDQVANRVQYREQLDENGENRTSTFGGWKQICRPTIAPLVKKCILMVKENQRLGFVTMRLGSIRPGSPPRFFHAFSRRVGHLYFSAFGMLRITRVTHTDRTQHTAHTQHASNGSQGPRNTNCAKPMDYRMTLSGVQLVRRIVGNPSACAWGSRHDGLSVCALP